MCVCSEFRSERSNCVRTYVRNYRTLRLRRTRCVLAHASDVRRRRPRIFFAPTNQRRGETRAMDARRVATRSHGSRDGFWSKAVVVSPRQQSHLYWGCEGDFAVSQEQRFTTRRKLNYTSCRERSLWVCADNVNENP